MNRHLTVSCLGVVILLALTSSASATGKTAGLPCTNSSPDNIQTVASDAADDLLACVSGSWHSMISGGSSPSGAVSAFNTATCPPDWSEVQALAGRTIIGAGNGGGLTPHSPGDYGGEERHTMSWAELVPHNVTFTFGASDKGGSGNGFAYSDNAGGSTVRAVYTKSSNTIGGGQPFNVMMPYYALLYCMKQ